MTANKISVIVPIYNADKYLKKCLDSIVNQSYRNLEIILVNDGSTDSSSKIMEIYAAKDKRILTIHKENGGIGSAYRVAFGKVTGDYIAFVDSDDYIDLDTYKELIEIAKNKDPDIIHFGRVLLNDRDQIIQIHKTINETIEGTDYILKKHFTFLRDPSLASRLFNKYLFVNVNIFDQNIGIDEMLIVQLLSKCKKSVYVKNIYYYTYAREDSVSRMPYSRKKVKEGIHVQRFICDFMDEHHRFFSPYLYIKYLNYILYVYDSLEADRSIRQSNEFDSLQKDLNLYYNKSKKTKEFKRSNLLLRLKLYILVRHPNLYTPLKLFLGNIMSIWRKYFKTQSRQIILCK